MLEDGFFISDRSWSCPEAGYVGDFLFQKRFCSRANRTNLNELKLEGVSQIGEIGWCVRERFLIQAELGSGDFRWHSKNSGSSVSGRVRDGLIWSGGAKLLILEAKETSIAVDGHAGGWDWMSTDESSESKLRYWQFGVGVVQKISLFNPYLGVAVNRTRLSVDHLHLHAKNTVGPFIGCSLTNGSKFFINLEWREWFENGLSLSGQVRF